MDCLRWHGLDRKLVKEVDKERIKELYTEGE